MLYPPGLHLVAAERRAGSSITAMNIARWAALGEPIFGIGQPFPRPAAYAIRGKYPDQCRRFFSGSPVEVVPIAQVGPDDIREIAARIRASSQVTGGEHLPVVIGIDPARAATPTCSVNADLEIEDRLYPLKQAAIECSAALVLSHYMAKQPSKAAVFTRIAGAHAWTSEMQTITCVDLASLEPIDPRRSIHHYLNEEDDFTWDAKISKTGVLVPGEISPMDEHLNALGPGQEFETELVIAVFEEVGKKRSTAERWIRRAIEQNRIERVGKGTYRTRGAPEPQAPPMENVTERGQLQ